MFVFVPSCFATSLTSLRIEQVQSEIAYSTIIDPSYTWTRPDLTDRRKDIPALSPEYVRPSEAISLSSYSHFPLFQLLHKLLPKVYTQENCATGHYAGELKIEYSQATLPPPPHEASSSSTSFPSSATPASDQAFTTYDTPIYTIPSVSNQSPISSDAFSTLDALHHLPPTFGFDRYSAPNDYQSSQASSELYDQYNYSVQPTSNGSRYQQ